MLTFPGPLLRAKTTLQGRRIRVHSAWTGGSDGCHTLPNLSARSVQRHGGCTVGGEALLGQFTPFSRSLSTAARALCASLFALPRCAAIHYGDMDIGFTELHVVVSEQHTHCTHLAGHLTGVSNEIQHLWPRNPEANGRARRV